MKISEEIDMESHDNEKTNVSYFFRSKQDRNVFISVALPVISLGITLSIWLLGQHMALHSRLSGFDRQLASITSYITEDRATNERLDNRVESLIRHINENSVKIAELSTKKSARPDAFGASDAQEMKTEIESKMDDRFQKILDALNDRR